MSLISEALRKARQQAAEEGDQRRGVLYSWSPGARVRGTRLGLGLVLGAVIALAAALAGAGAVWWVVGHRGPSEGGAQGVSSDAGTPDVSSVDQGATAPLTDLVATSPDSASAGRASQPDAGVREPSVGRSDPTVEPSSDVPAAKPAAQPRPAPAIDPDSAVKPTVRSGVERPETATIGPDGERIYLIEADLGGVTLTLDYIVFRPDDPFAEINGLEVHVGSTVEGFTVEAIERNHVRLRDDQGLVILRAP